MNRLKKIKIPTPLELAIVLSLVTFVIALIYTNPGDSIVSYSITLIKYYQLGFWDLLAFSMQMMLILVLGNVIALTPAFQKIIKILISHINDSTSAVVITVIFSIILSLINWGLGLIFSALLARSIAEQARLKNIKLNYPLLVAAAYTGMMVWHAGLSGSAPLKVAEANHFLIDQIGMIPVKETIFSTMNIALAISFIILLPFSFFIISKIVSKTSTQNNLLPKPKSIKKAIVKKQYLHLIFGAILSISVIYALYFNGINALNLNIINLALFSISLLLFPNLSMFMDAVNNAIKSSSGIMIQFPIYAGIMGLMKYSGLIALTTNQLISISDAQTLPIYSFISASIINFFVPSGGGQWAIQGPILTSAALQMGVPIPKIIMSLAYGDQITNMIQPFWAIPLLSITGVKVKDMLPYSAIIMVIGIIISILILYFF